MELLSEQSHYCSDWHISNCAGTPEYMAPEMLPIGTENQIFNPAAADIFRYVRIVCSCAQMHDVCL